ncbi:MAG: nickel pincer cofactor biosynthesis protein LarB [Synergistaceae bacterium]|jgi:NCAIR mutase (PurE)-related protein|nr:nickel pincer cofactor biosynthesis protein LarB [Synergistaceae bacterium]
MDEKRDGARANEALNRMRALPFENVAEDVKLDTHRSARTGFSEIIYCPGKSDEQLANIAQALRNTRENVLFSRVSEHQHQVIASVIPGAVSHRTARLTGVRRQENPHYKGVAVVTAGSGDIPVAEEAAITAEYMGCDVLRLYDVGVAGLHRLLAHVDELQSAQAIVVVAGMEGALPTVVGGLVSCPVVAVPTSAGYGANLGGLAPLLTMLNSCAMGVTVVNIDNGLGAGYTAATIVRQCHQALKAQASSGAEEL